MEGREVGDRSERIELQLLGEVPVDVLEHAVHACRALGAAFA